MVILIIYIFIEHSHFFTHRLDWQTKRLTSKCGSGSTIQSSSEWSIGTFVSKILAWYYSLNYFRSVYSNLGLGFAFGCLIIIAEIIYAKFTKPRNFKSGCGTILFLLTFSVILTIVTVIMIQTYYNPIDQKDLQMKKGWKLNWSSPVFQKVQCIFYTKPF